MSEQVTEEQGQIQSTRPPHAYLRSGNQGDEIDLLDYLRPLYKRRWTAVASFLVIVLGVTAYTFSATPIYEARTKLLIEPENPNVISFQEVIEEGEARNDYYETQYNILRSRSLAGKTLDALNLWEHPEFGPASHGTLLSLSQIAEAVSSVVPLPRNHGREAPVEAAEALARSHTTDAFLDNLRVSPLPNSRLVDVTFGSSDPALARDVVNALARAYIEQSLELRFGASQEASVWLGERLADQRQVVEDTEEALQRYREQNDALSLEERQDIDVRKLAELSEAVTAARIARIEDEARYNQLKSIEDDRPALDTFPAILADPFIRQLKTEQAALHAQYAQLSDNRGELHPDMVKLRLGIDALEDRIQTEVVKAVQSVRNEFLAAQGREQGLMAALEAQKTAAFEMSQKGIEYGALHREAESNRLVYESLLQRAKETSVSSELTASNIRIVDPAELPRTPATPRTMLSLFLAVFLGAVLAVSLPLSLEYLDTRIKTPDDITTTLGLLPFGLVPEIASKNGAGATLPGHNDATPRFVEAFTTVQANVRFASPPGRRSVVVTSTGPEEGKTVVATNLASALAQSGETVLLLDADMRRPRTHVMFGEALEPGLSDLMLGKATVRETIRKSTVPHLSILPAGAPPSNPAQLLGSKRFLNLLNTCAGSLRLGRDRLSTHHECHRLFSCRTLRVGCLVRRRLRDDQRS